MNYEIGDKIQIGAFFWIENAIGYSGDAHHGHGLHDLPHAGSADTDCYVQVVEKASEGEWIVKLLRPTEPFGAPAPHGTVFKINPDVFSEWANKIEEDAIAARAEANIAHGYHENHGRNENG